ERQDRGGDGGADRGERGGADDLRHVQGGRQGDGDRAGAADAQGRRQERRIRPPGRGLTWPSRTSPASASASSPSATRAPAASARMSAGRPSGGRSRSSAG